MRTPINLSRRELIAGAGVALAHQSGRLLQAQTKKTTVFTHTTAVTVDAVQDDVALAVTGDVIAAIGPTDTVLQNYPGAEVYDGRGKALFPGLVNCHAHLAATLQRGYNEDYGFPNSNKLPLQTGGLLSGEESTLMCVMGALESIRCGATTVVQNAGNISSSAKSLVQTGLRWVFAESAGDKEGGGAMSLEALVKSDAPKFSPKMRETGLQRISDLYASWHGKNNGKISVFPAAGLAEAASPDLLRAVRDFADKHDLGYTIHLAQSRWECEYMMKYHGLRPTAFLDKHGFLGPRLFAAHCRYVDGQEIALLGKTKTIVTHQAPMAANRGVIPPISALRAAGCTIANGTDNNTNDMHEVMRIALVTERISRNDEMPGILPQPEDILEDATKGGAQAVNQAKTLGSLEVGKKADIVVLDTLKAHLVPALRIVSAWIHNGQPSDIESVMVDGEFVMKKGKILTVDEPALIAEADKVGKRVWGKVKEAGPIPVPGRPLLRY